MYKATLSDLRIMIKLGTKVVKPVSMFGLGIGYKGK